MVEGKLKIWIKGGKFQFSNDLYVKVLCDKREVWKTDESDSSTPAWNSTVTKHVKGPYEKLIFQLLDEDTFSKDDLLGSCEVEFITLKESAVVGDIGMKDSTGKNIGTLDVSIEYEPGDVNKFQLMQSRIHTSDSD